MKEYKTILIDPPWKSQGGGKSKRGADRHYALLSNEEIIEAILDCPVYKPAKDAHLYLCAINNYLIVAGGLVMPEIGFRYITDLTWAKDHWATGRYFLSQTEHVLFGVRGRGFAVRTARNDLSTLLKARSPRHVDGPMKGRIIHSAKPRELYERIEARSKGPYLELFARGENRPGWDAWGLEAK
jgi:N6-adenosine-specific RNA methylase IME4